MRLFCFLVLLSGLPTACQADDVILVTAQTGYLLDNDGQIVRTARMYDTFTVSGILGDFVQVALGSGQTARIHRGQVHLLSQQWHVAGDELAEVPGILELVQRAHNARTSEEGKVILQQAIEQAQGVFGHDSVIVAWVQAVLALEFAEAGDQESARGLMHQARRAVASARAEEHPLTGEVFNIDGLIDLEYDRYARARRRFQKAIEVAEMSLGRNHQDVAVCLLNRSFATDADSESGDAANDIKASNAILQRVLPASVIEHPRGLIELADVYLDARQPEKAISTLTSAMGLLRAYHIDQKVDVARCQLYLGAAWQQREQYLEAERWYNGIDLQLPEAATDEDRSEMLGFRKEIQHALGDIDFTRSNFRAALDHYMNAAELIDDDNMETLDGWSYVYAADALAELGQRERAQRLYKGAWLIFEQTDGAESRTALDAKRLFIDAGGVVTAGNSTADQARSMSKADPLEVIGTAPMIQSDQSDADPLADGIPEMAAYAMTIRPGEGMLKTTAETPIMGGSEVLARVPTGTKLWSLEQKDQWHKVLIPGTARRAWVSAKLVTSEYDTLARNLSREINQRAGDATAAGSLNRKLLELLPQVQKTMNTEGLAAAVSLQERVVHLVEQALGPGSYLTVSVRSQLSVYYLSNRQFVKARQLIEAALPSMRSVYGNDHPIVARELNRLASLLGMIGDEAGRQRCLEEALAIAHTRFGSGDRRVTGLQLNLAAAMTSGGQFDEAEKIYRRVMKAVDGMEQDRIAKVLAQSGLGALRLLERRYAESIAILRGASEECQQIGDAVRTTRGAIAMTAAMALFSAGDLQQAEDQLRQVSELFASADQIPLPIELQLLAVKSRIHGKRGDWALALSVTNDVLERAAKLFGEDSVQLSGPWTGRGRALASLGRIDDAAVAFHTARQIVHEHVINTLADLPVSQQINYLRSNSNPLLHVALSLGLQSHGGTAVAELSAAWLLNSKNLANELAARDMQVRRLCTSDHHLASYESWLDGRRRLATLPPLTAEEARDEHIRETKIRLSRDTDGAFDSLPTEVREFLKQRRSPWITVARVQAALREGEVFLDFARIRKSSFDGSKEAVRSDSGDQMVYAVWLIPARDAGSVQVLELGPADDIDDQVINPYLGGIRESVGKLRELGEDGALAELTGLNQALTKHLWLPIAKHIPAKTNRLVICPDSMLWQVPWAAVEDQQRNLLLESFTIRFVCSGRDLLKQEVGAVDLFPPAVLADPDFGASTDEIEKRLEELPLRSVSARMKNVDATLLQQILPDDVARLRGTAAEAAAVQPLVSQFSGMKADMFLRAAASEASLRLTRRPHTLFVGTHGFFLPEEDLPDQEILPGRSSLAVLPKHLSQKLNPLRRCGLLFAGCSNKVSGSDRNTLDGIVTGEELVGLDLRGTKLVVLSACETGLGDLTDGQGVSGLRQAIQLAGAESVVSTLWEIPDRETTPLMTEFFRNLADGRSRSDALRMAQLNRIQARRERYGAAHPLFWAAFTVTGLD